MIPRLWTSGAAGGACEQERSRRRHRASEPLSHRDPCVDRPFSTEYATGSLPIRYSVEIGLSTQVTGVPKNIWSLTPPSLACEGHKLRQSACQIQPALLCVWGVQTGRFANLANNLPKWYNLVRHGYKAPDPRLFQHRPTACCETASRFVVSAAALGLPPSPSAPPRALR